MGWIGEHAAEVLHCDASEVDFGGVRIASVVWEILVACDIVALVIPMVQIWPELVGDVSEFSASRLC